VGLRFARTTGDTLGSPVGAKQALLQPVRRLRLLAFGTSKISPNKYFKLGSYFGILF
jgi:hypothetical protein